MKLGQVVAIAKQDLRVLRTDLMPVVAVVVLPLLLMPFLVPAFDEALRVNGLPTATGAEQAVPGMAVAFSFFLVANMVFSFFREHSWHTWERLRASTAGAAEILLGKTIVPLLQAAAQFVVLFVFGGFLIGLDVKGSWLGLAAIGGCFGLYLVMTGLAVIALCRTFLQASLVASICGLLLAGFSGSIVPFDLLPQWAQDVAPAVPGYWAMQGYEDVIMGGGAGILAPVLILLAFSFVLGFIALLRFRLDETKVGFV